MQRNGRIPTIKITIHFLKELTVDKIRALREKVFRILRRAGLQAVVAIELSRTKPRTGSPNNQVHYHFLTDDERSEDELRALFNKACKDSGLGKKDFRIDYGTVDDGYWYFDYFTKFDRKNQKFFKVCNTNRKDLVEGYRNISKILTGKHAPIEYDRMKDDILARYRRKTKAHIAKFNRENKINDRDWDWRTVLLFEKGLGIQKFYTIGKWFSIPKGDFWNEIKDDTESMKEAIAEDKRASAEYKAAREKAEDDAEAAARGTKSEYSWM